MNYNKVGVWLAIIALLVNVPRFVLVFLRVDGIVLPLEVEGVMLGASGIATGLVLTGGGAFIAHRLAESKVRGIPRIFLVLCWLSLLVFSVILLAPLLVSAIRTSPLKDVFSSNFSQWLWAVVAVLAVEVLAAGSVAATAVKDEGEHTQGDEPSVFSLLLKSLIRRMEHHIAPRLSVHSPNSSEGSETTVPKAVGTGKITSQSVTGDIQQETNPPAQNDPLERDEAHIEAERQHSKSERQKLLLELIKPLTKEEDIAVDELADHLGVSRQTIYRDLSELKKTNQLWIEEGKIVLRESGN